MNWCAYGGQPGDGRAVEKAITCTPLQHVLRAIEKLSTVVTNGDLGNMRLFAAKETRT